MRIITMEFTEEQAEKLSDVLQNTWDEGPEDEGWPSNELRTLRNIVDLAIEQGRP